MSATLLDHGGHPDAYVGLREVYCAQLGRAPAGPRRERGLHGGPPVPNFPCKSAAPAWHRVVDDMSQDARLLATGPGRLADKVSDRRELVRLRFREEQASNPRKALTWIWRQPYGLHPHGPPHPPPPLGSL